MLVTLTGKDEFLHRLCFLLCSRFIIVMVEYRKYDKISIYFDPRFNEKEYRKYDKVSIYFDPRFNKKEYRKYDNVSIYFDPRSNET